MYFKIGGFLMMREPNNTLSHRHRGLQQIRITLWHNAAMRDWSVEIDGQCHEHVTAEVVEALVECQLIVAETSLAHQQYLDPRPSVAQRAM